MTILRHTHAAAAVRYQIFSYFAKNVIGVSLIVVHVKCIIKKLAQIAVTKSQVKRHQKRLANAQERQRQELDAKRKLPVQIVDVTCTKYLYEISVMKKTILFAIDFKTEEILVSESEKGSNKVNLIERIHRKTNELLFNTVVVLTQISNSADFDIAIFTAADKICQMVYSKHIKNN